MISLLASLILTSEPTPGHPVALPTEYVENRFAVRPVAVGGRKLRFFTDTGGGHFIDAAIAKELKLPLETESQGEDTATVAPYPTFEPRASIPPAIGAQLFVFDSKKLPHNEAFSDYDGLLGQPWFAGRTWTFDYLGKTLYWRAPGDLPKHEKQHETKLYFRMGRDGRHETDFARIEAQVDGETLGFLFDTGATNVLPEDALKEIADGRPANRATSFLTEGTYQKWHKKHPGWRVIEKKTLTGRAMIEVPKVTVGGYAVGPVWFTVQGDKAFHEYMAQWMDKPTEGALGGSAFKYFRISADWLKGVAVFEQ